MKARDIFYTTLVVILIFGVITNDNDSDQSSGSREHHRYRNKPYSAYLPKNPVNIAPEYKPPEDKRNADRAIVHNQFRPFDHLYPDPINITNNPPAPESRRIFSSREDNRGEIVLREFAAQTLPTKDSRLSSVVPTDIDSITHYSEKRQHNITLSERSYLADNPYYFRREDHKANSAYNSYSRNHGSLTRSTSYVYRSLDMSKPVYVRGYYKEDGTFVRSHTRKRPRD